GANMVDLILVTGPILLFLLSIWLHHFFPSPVVPCEGKAFSSWWRGSLPTVRPSGVPVVLETDMQERDKAHSMTGSPASLISIPHFSRSVSNGYSLQTPP